MHVFLEDDEEDGYIEDSIQGFLLMKFAMTQYDGQMLSRKMKKQIDRATKDQIKPREGTRILDEYLKVLKSQTYLSESN